MFAQTGEVIVHRTGIQITNSDSDKVNNYGTLLYRNIKKIVFDNDTCLTVTFWKERGYMLQCIHTEDRSKLLNVFNALKTELYREVPDFDAKNIIGAKLIGGTLEQPQPPKPGLLQKLLQWFKQS